MKLNMDFIELNIPINCKIILWNKNNDNKNVKININHFSKKFNFFFNKKNIKIDKWCNSLIFFNKYNLKFFENFFKLWNIYYLSKIKFKGKGFKIKFLKKNKLIKFYFGKSHITQILLKKIMKKKINKYKFVLFGLNKNKLINNLNKIKNIKEMNFYTLRGIRSSRQIIYKRKGKKGTYI